ncbi:MAG: spermidine synthase [Deltaproteobacteria bacterium]|nr:spermidine synthase [Deltaproteobacteria bacterium]
MSDLDVLESSDSPLGTIYLGRRRVASQPDWVYEIWVSGHILMSSLNNVSERQLSTTALKLHEGTGPLRVLVGGLGLGYTAEAALVDAGVAKLRVVEKMDFVIDWMKGGLLPLSAEFADDDRLEIVQGDIYEDLLGAPSELYDLILVDVDHAPDFRLDDGIGRFYTAEGQKLVAQHLAPGGVLAVWSAWDNAPFAELLGATYARSCREEVRWDDVEAEGRSFSNMLFFASGVAES